MGVPVIVLKAAVTAASDKKGRNVIAVVIAAVLVPLITIILIICSLFTGVENANTSLLDLSFTDMEIPEDMNDEQREAITEMRGHLAELDILIAEKEESGLDGNMVKAVFYSLQFGVPADDPDEDGSPPFEYEKFCGCFDGLTFVQLDTALENVSYNFPQYEITDDHKKMIKFVYDYLKGKQL